MELAHTNKDLKQEALELQGSVKESHFRERAMPRFERGTGRDIRRGVATGLFHRVQEIALARVPVNAVQWEHLDEQENLSNDNDRHTNIITEACLIVSMKILHESLKSMLQVSAILLEILDQKTKVLSQVLVNSGARVSINSQKSVGK